MWKVLLGMVLAVALIALGGAVYIGLALYKPEVVRPDLTREYGVTGLTVGLSTKDQMTARFGLPTREQSNTLDTVYMYADRDLVFHIDKAAGTLSWYEVGTKAYPTARGVRVGDSLSRVRSAYGNPDFEALIGGQLRLRYTYGTRYALEFWLGSDSGAVERILFYRA